MVYIISPDVIQWAELGKTLAVQNIHEFCANLTAIFRELVAVFKQ